MSRNGYRNENLTIYRYEDKEVQDCCAQAGGYGIEVACKATSRKLMCGASTEAEGMALTVSHPMKVDVDSLAKDICDATTALSHGYRVELAGPPSLCCLKLASSLYG